MPTLVEIVDQFLYTHAPNMHYKAQLLNLVREGERQYQSRIDELEDKVTNGNRVTEKRSSPAYEHVSDPYARSRYEGVD